jgi:hypothetical protein
MTYTERLRYLHQLELEKDAEQESKSTEMSRDDIANRYLSVIKCCLGHIENATRLISKGYDVDHQARIIKAQIKPISDNVSRLEKMGRKDLVGEDAIRFLENIVIH